MENTEMAKLIWRYTNIPALIYLLRERKITLLDPESWDDKNDSHYMSLYREKKKLKSVLALCFTQVPETYHHWRVFADGSSGISIRFKRQTLMTALESQPGVQGRSVRYLMLKDIRNMQLKTVDLPFLKRSPYEDEVEFRVIYESATVKKPSLDIGIPLSCIDRITLSPWIPMTLRDHIEATIREIKGCKDLSIVRSTLISNEQWKNIGDEAV